MAATSPSPSPRSRTWRRLAIGAGVLLGLFVVALLAVPWILSTDWFREFVVETSEEELDGTIRIEDLSFGWSSGLTLRQVSFEAARQPSKLPRFRAREVQGSFSLRRLLDEQLVGEFAVRGAEIAVDRSLLRSGEAPEITTSRPRPPDATPGSRDDPPPSWTLDLRLDLEDSHLLLFDGTPDRVVLSGTFDGTWKASGSTGGELEFGGALEATDLRVSDRRIPSDLPVPPALKLATAGRWSAADEGLGVPRLSLDWGPHRLSGEFRTSSDERVETSLQLAIAEQWIVPLARKYVPALEVSGGLGVELRGRAPLGSWDPGSWPSVVAGATLSLPAITWVDQRVSEPAITVDVAEGIARFQVTPGSSTLKGLDLEGSYDLSGGVTDLRLSWQRSKIGGSLTPGLRYVFPVFAGLQAQGLEALSRLDFLGEMELDLHLRGPTFADGRSGLELLQQWSGEGSVQVHEGEFSPAPAFQRLLELLDEDQRLSFSKISSKFQIADGAVHGPDIQLRHEKTPLALRGTTRLSGEIDYALDLSSLLEGHRDGDRILKVIGGRSLDARITGTVFQPRLQVADLVENSLNNLREGILERAQEDPQGMLEDLLDVFGRKKKRGGEKK